MLSLEVRFAELSFDGGELALKNPDQKIPASARGLEESSVDTLGLALYEIKHGVDKPSWRKDLAVIRNPLFGFD